MDGSPEKADGGGSIPSMATIESTAYKPSLTARSATAGFLKSVGMAMVGDSQAAMAELLGRGHEN